MDFKSVGKQLAKKIYKENVVTVNVDEVSLRKKGTMLNIYTLAFAKTENT